MLTIKNMSMSWLLLFVAICANAQNVTYNHDSSKKNQIMVMETGGGALTPELYYTLLHNSYKKTAASKNKLGYRTLASVGAYQQVEYADSMESYTTQRAEIEALNVADRQVDLAWQVEGTKINDKLSTFQNNINRIVPAGGTAQDRERWNTYYQMFQAAVKSTRESYLPNAQRKRQYLQIYADISSKNETLVKHIVQMHNKAKTAELLSDSNNYQKSTKLSAIATANSRWREAAANTKSSSSNSTSDDDDGDETVNR